MNKKTIAVFIIYLPFLFFPYLTKNYWEVSYLNHAFFLAFYAVILMTSKEGMRFILSPASITCLYLYICFLLGDLLFRNGLNLYSHHYDHYSEWKHYELASTYTNICIYLALLSYFFVKKRTPIPRAKVFNNSTITVLLVLFACSVPLASFDLPGGVNKVIMFLSSVGIIYYCSIHVKSSRRFLFYVLILFFIAIANPDDKRNSIFMVYIILIVESRFITKISLKYTILGIFGAATVFILIVLMSVLRTGISSLSEAINFMPTYLTGDLILGALANNFEIDYTFIDSFTPIEFIEENTSRLNYGMSYLKVLFLPISRDIMPDKPEATMILYTKIYDPSGAATGLCYPINLAAEAYWNFRYFGVFVVPIFYYILNAVYCKGLRLLNRDLKSCNFKTLLFLYVMYYTTLLIRGSGFDIYVSSILIGWAIIQIIKIPLGKTQQKQ